MLTQARIQDFLQGGRGSTTAVYSGRLGLLNIRLRYIASIEYFCFFAIVKKFVEKKNWWSRAGGARPPPWIRACYYKVSDSEMFYESVL